MSNPTITIEQMRAERDAACQEAERLSAELEEANDANGKWHEEWEKDCSRELRRLADLTGFEWEVDGSPADVIREHIELTLQQRRQEADQNAALVWVLINVVRHVNEFILTGQEIASECQIYTACQKVKWALSLTPPSALERVQREAAAKALEEVADLPWFAYIYTDKNATPDMLRKRAAELREGK